MKLCKKNIVISGILFFSLVLVGISFYYNLEKGKVFHLFYTKTNVINNNFQSNFEIIQFHRHENIYQYTFNRTTFEKKHYAKNDDSTYYFFGWVYNDKKVGDSWESNSELDELCLITLIRKYDTIIDNSKLTNCASYFIEPLVSNTFHIKKCDVNIENRILLKTSSFRNKFLEKKMKIDSIIEYITLYRTNHSLDR